MEQNTSVNAEQNSGYLKIRFIRTISKYRKDREYVFKKVVADKFIMAHYAVEVK